MSGLSDENCECTRNPWTQLSPQDGSKHIQTNKQRIKHCTLYTTSPSKLSTRNVEDALCKTNSAELYIGTGYAAYIGTGYAASKNSQSLVSITVQA